MLPPSNDSILDLPEARVESFPPRVQNYRGSFDSYSMSSSIPSLRYRASNPSLSSIFTSTSTPTESRSSSPAGLKNIAKLRVSPIFESSPGNGQYLTHVSKAKDPRNLILQAFVPHIAVHTSADTNELVNEKGFKGGLWELLRPFGECIQGKVTVRDSFGAGKTWEDYAVHFVHFGINPGTAKNPNPKNYTDEKSSAVNGNKIFPDTIMGQREKSEVISSIEILVDKYLTYAEDLTKQDNTQDYLAAKEASQNPDNLSPFYTLYLRRLISSIPIAPHETFSHPVACIIAISSRNTSPLETLRDLYEESSSGEQRLPFWVNNEYLRYYVLIHDEERNDITKSICLFDQMKRHFGLHCHLLRLRSSQCVASDDDSARLPRCSWLSAQEELADLVTRDAKDEVEYSSPYIYESDTTAIKTFIREMVTQSIIPSMERCVATWNDQIASRRRGFSGRLLSISRQWTGFGRSSRNSSAGNTGSVGSNCNFDHRKGYYKPDAPEALMRKLADYAFMLRDWKLALTTYDLLRSDFNSDKAWKYHAAANEMAAISALLVPRSMNTKTRSETIDQFLETASYSYITRCGATHEALRCLLLGMELLRFRGGSSASDAAKWGLRLLEYNVVGPVGDALIKERISSCYASRKGIGSGRWGSRTRKSALWSTQASDSWLAIGKFQRSKLMLNEAKNKYSLLQHGNALETYPAARHYLESLEREVKLAISPVNDGNLETNEPETLIDESGGFQSRQNRRSLMGRAASPLSGLVTIPLEKHFSESQDKITTTDQSE